MKAIILAAGRGSRMEGMTSDMPKGFVRLFDKPLICYQMDALKEAGVNDITIVTGYLAEKYQNLHNKTIRNERWSETNMVKSLLCADALLSHDTCLVSYSDIFYDPSAPEALIDTAEECAITYDPHWLAIWQGRFQNPLDDAETFKVDDEGYLLEIGQKAENVSDVKGQYMGLLKFTPEFWSEAKKFLLSLEQEALDKLDMTSFLQHLIVRKKQIKAIPIDCLWGEIDSQSDLNYYQHNKNYIEKFDS